MIPTIVHPGELSSATIQSIQQELKEAGYDPGPVDGRWGPRTKVAYDNFLGGGRRRIVAPSQGERVLCTTSYHALRPDRQLADHLGLKTQALLRDAQRRWLHYRDADQLLINAVYELTQGTMFAPMQAYSHLRLVRERSLMLKSYFTALTNPKARKDLPRAGKEKEDPENSGSLEVDYPPDDSLDHCIDQHATPSEQASCVEEALGRWDEAMNAVYQKLTERPSKSTLVEAQRAWLVFRDAEYLLIDSIYETLPSLEYQPLHAYWRLRLTRERALLLKKYLALAGSEEATN